MTEVVITQLVVDASGAEVGVADFKSAMESARASAVETGAATGSSFDRAMKSWQQSLAKSDPLIRAQIRMQQDLARQTRINTEAVRLGIATQEAADAQLQRVRVHHEQTIENIRKHVNATDNAVSSTGQFSRALATVSEWLAAFGLALGVGALVQWGRSVFATVASLEDQAAQIGYTIEELQAYRTAFLQSSISVEQGDNILRKFVQNIGDAKNAMGPARKALIELGVSAEEVASPSRGLSAAAAALLKIPDVTARARLETDLFGKSGQALESTLSKLAVPADELIARAKDLGVVLDDDLAHQVNAAESKLGLMQKQIVVAVVPAIVSLVDNIAKAATNVSNLAVAVSALDWSHFIPQGAAAAIGEISGKVEDLAQRLYIADGLRAGLNALNPVAAVRDGWNTLNDLIAAATGKLKEYAAIEKVVVTPMQKERVEAVQGWGDINEKVKEHTARIQDSNKAMRDLRAEVSRLVEDYRKAVDTYNEFHASLADDVKLAAMSREDREIYLAREKEILLAKQAGVAADIDGVEAMVRLKQGAEKYRSVVDDTARGFEDFFKNVLLGKGKNAFQNLVAYIKEQFAALLAWMIARAIAQPVIVPIVQQLFGSAGGIAQTLFGSNGVGGGSLSSLFNLGSQAASSSAGGLFGQIGSYISGGVNWFMNGLNSLGASLGFASPWSAALAASGTGIGATIGGSLTGVLPGLFGSLSLGNLLGAGFGGFGIGGLMGSLLGGNSLGSGIGGALGGIVGSIIPGIGTILGSLLGGALGGLFGNKSPHHANIFFGADWDVTKVSSKVAKLASAAGQVGDAVSQIVQALQSAGVTIAASVDRLQIAEGKDPSYLYLKDGTRVQVGAPGDPQSAIEGALKYILGTATSDDSFVAAVLKHYNKNGGIDQNNISEVLSSIDFAKSLEKLNLTAENLSQTEQAIGAINDQIDALTEKAKQLELPKEAFDNIEKAAAAAFKALRDGFDKGIADQLKAIEHPITAAMDQLLESQKQRLKDARAVKADLAQVLALNEAEQRQVIQGYRSSLQGLAASFEPQNQWLTALKQIGEAEAAATEAAVALGRGLSYVKADAEAARLALAKAFDRDIAAKTAAITNSITDQIDALLAEQKHRRHDANAVGGDLNAVHALNKAERDSMLAKYIDPLIAASARDNLSEYGHRIAAINVLYKDAAEALTALGKSLDEAKMAARDAAKIVRVDFRRSIASQFLDAVNPAAGGYIAQHLQAQQNLADAKALGVGLDQVRALNRVEMEQFLLGLTADQRKALEKSGALSDKDIKLAVTIDRLGNHLDKLGEHASNAADAAQKAVTDWTAARDTLQDARRALLVATDVGLSPQSLYENSRAEFDRLRRLAMGGDAKSANELSGFAAQFLQSSLQYNASSPAYRQDFQLVQNALRRAARFAGGEVSDAQRQLDTANQQLARLQNIQNSIASGQPSLAVLERQLGLSGDTRDWVEKSVSILDDVRAQAVTLDISNDNRSAEQSRVANQQLDRQHKLVLGQMRQIRQGAEQLAELKSSRREFAEMKTLINRLLQEVKDANQHARAAG